MGAPHEISERPVSRRAQGSGCGRKLLFFSLLVLLGAGAYWIYQQYVQFAKMSIAQLYGQASQQSYWRRPIAVLVLRRRYATMPSNRVRLHSIRRYMGYRSAKVKALALEMLATLKLTEETRSQDLRYALEAADLVLQQLDDYYYRGYPGGHFQRSRSRKTHSTAKHVRLAAMQTVVTLKPHWWGHRRACSLVDLLVALLKHPDEELQLQAARTLRLCTGQKFGHNYDKWSIWWSQNRRNYRGFPKY